MVRIKVKRLTETAKLPEKTHDTDTGYDIFADKIEFVHGTRNQLKVHTGLAIQPEPGYYIEVAPRSSVYKKYLQLANSVAVIDETYRGELILIFNMLPIDCEMLKGGSTSALVYSTSSYIKPNEKIAQIIIRKRLDADFIEVDELDNTVRGTGGFGSTGV